MRELDWYGLYARGWGGDLVSDAYSHPAKVRPALSRRIYGHAAKMGWLKRGMTIVDPFAGICGFALSAMECGLHFVGVELEEKFVELGRQNIEMWNGKYSRLPRWGSAVVVQGDSRQLLRVLAEVQVAGVVSSPPYSELQTKTGKVDESAWSDGQPRPVGISQRESDGYGQNPNNLGNLRATSEGHAEALVSSPPYADGCAHQGGDDPHPEHIEGGTYCGVGIEGCVSSPPYAESLGDGKSGIDWSKQADRDTAHPHGWDGEGYGVEDGQLGRMRVEGMVSSPPFEAVIPRDGRGTDLKIHRQLEKKYNRRYSERSFPKDTYGSLDGQLGQEKGDTFWAAARTIMEQCFLVLRPSAVAIWTLKSFVRQKRIVDFPDQWRQLGEACGFETIEWIRAWLVEDRGTQIDLMGEHHHRQVERKSFFRRLAEKKGSPRIDYEMVLVQRRPG